MSKKHFFPVLFLFMIMLFPLNAATVSFLVIEAGLPMESPSVQYSGLWESGLLDVFFESGHIVSNAPMMRLEYQPAGGFPEEAQQDLDDALEGGVDYFIIALLEYQNREDNTARPQNISLRVFRTSPCKMIYERQYSDTKSKTIHEEYNSLKQIVRGLVPRLN